MKTCVQCGGPLTGRQQRYCTPLCASRGFNAARRADGRLKAYREGKGREKRAAWAQANKGRYRGRYFTSQVCAACGEAFEVPWDARRLYCDEICRALTPKPRTPRGPRTRQAIARAKLKRAARGTTGKGNRWVEGPCRRCGDRFLARSVGPIPAAYCSTVCKRKDIKDRYLARRRGADIGSGSRYAVYCRDGWVCQICGDPVDRDARVPELGAPVIDHRIPLARGGAHAEHNWQTAHFYCNSVKQDTDLDIRPAA